jgi:predicted TIM-barrel fold metal-dependent hydrolase
VDYIDSHVHVWTDDFGRYPLAAGVSVQAMELRRFLPNQILAHARMSGVGRIVLIQMSYYGTDNRYMLDVLAASPQTFRGVAIIDPLGRDVPEQMDKLRPLGVRGFRIYLTDLDAAKQLESGAWDRMFQAAAEKGMVLCTLINPEFLPALSRVCARFPETPVVVDHLGRIGMSGPIEQGQVRSLCDLSRHARVRIKVSAFYALGEKRPPHLELSDLILRVYDSLGPQRLLWGSDCPFQIVSEPYEASIAVIRDHLSFLSEDDREWILHRTAEELFFS